MLKNDLLPMQYIKPHKLFNRPAQLSSPLNNCLTPNIFLPPDQTVLPFGGPFPCLKIQSGNFDLVVLVKWVETYSAALRLTINNRFQGCDLYSFYIRGHKLPLLKQGTRWCYPSDLVQVELFQNKEFQEKSLNSEQQPLAHFP